MRASALLNVCAAAQCAAVFRIEPFSDFGKMMEEKVLAKDI